MKKEAISKERWNFAQEGEKKFHEQESVEESFKHYESTFNYYFKYLGIDKDLKGKTIIEIGPARFAGLLYCNNYGNSYVIEPTTYKGVESYYSEKNIEVIRELYEDYESPNVDEVWLFNLLQHVQDPDLLIEKAKKHAKIIRFFEPIDLPTDKEHPFSFSEDDYRNYFGDSVQIYTSMGEKNFHGAKCVYGIYKCSN